jgi:Tol biopolymer transport system component
VRKAIAVLMVVFAGAACTPAAHATFPGTNGKIAYSNGFRGNAELYKVNPDGTGNGLLSGTTIALAPEWSPDGSAVVFVRPRLYDDPHLAQTSIVTKKVDTGVESPLTATSDDDEHPGWSPDGQRIVFTRWHETGCEYDHFGNPLVCFGSSRIIVMNSDGTNQAVLPTTSECDDEPSWSPDGSKIAFSRCSRGIWVMNPHGSDPAQLTGGMFDSQPDWAPDGRHLVFAHCPASGGCSMYSVNRDGSDLTQVVPGQTGGGINPHWSPDGSKIVFEY